MLARQRVQQKGSILFADDDCVYIVLRSEDNTSAAVPVSRAANARPKCGVVYVLMEDSVLINCCR